MIGAFNNLFLFDGSRVFVPPYIVASVSNIGGLTYQIGSGPSAGSPTFKILAAGLKPAAGNITVTPSANVEVYDGATWQSAPFTVPYLLSAANTASIYQVRLKAGLTTASYTGTVILSGANAANFTLNVTGRVTAMPVITVSGPTLPSFGDVILGDFSAAQSYTVSGADVTSNIVITAPAGYIINLDGSNTDAGPITLVQAGGTVLITTIYVKLNPLLPQTYAGNITNVSGGAATQNVAVTGRGVVQVAQRQDYYYHAT